MDRQMFYDKVHDQFCYLFNLWSTEAPPFNDFLSYYENKIADDAFTVKEASMPWRLRTFREIEDEMPEVLVNYMRSKNF